MIKRERLAEVILDFQGRSMPELVERDLKVELEVPLRRGIVVYGPRRSGKTYYFYSLIGKLLERGIEKRRILYIDFEDPRLVGMTLEDLIIPEYALATELHRKTQK